MSTKNALRLLIEDGASFARCGDQVRLTGSTPSPAAVKAVQDAKPDLLQLANNLWGLLFVQFVTRSSVRIDEVGVTSYMSQANFEILWATAVMPDGTVLDWLPDKQPPARILGELGRGAHVVAHDAHDLPHLVWRRLGWPEPVAWVDTWPLAGLAGLSREADELGMELFERPRDLLGQRLLRDLRRITQGATGTVPVPPKQRPVLARVSRRRLLTLRSAYALELHGFRGGFEQEVQRVDACVNQRGFPPDADLARGVIHLTSEVKTRRKREAKGAMSIASSASFKTWLSQAGIEVPYVTQAILTTLLQNVDLPSDVQLLVQDRLVTSGIAASKLTAGLKLRDTDDRVRFTLVYQGAKTGRWTGKGMQPHNLPRGVSLTSEDSVELMRVVRNGDLTGFSALAERLGQREHSLLASLVRRCIIPSPGCVLVVADFSQIEARVLLWLAHDWAGLSAFMPPNDDPYKVVAGMLFNTPVDAVSEERRTLGKVTMLGCGFGLGGAGLKLYGDTMGVPWDKLGVTPEQVVDSWRDANPRVAGKRPGPDSHYQSRVGGLWNGYAHAACEAIHSDISSTTGRCHWSMRNGSLYCRLPSGRFLIYRGAQLAKRSLGFTYTHGSERLEMYGTKLAENITQAVARDLLAIALVKVEHAGLNPILHIHDEVVCEVDARIVHDAEWSLKHACESRPSWAPDLPIAAKTVVLDRYQK